MIQRCMNPASPAYRLYGALGVKVCSEWQTFQGFLDSMGERPPGKTLDREDAFGDYEPNNCSWATPVQQARNRRVRTTTFREAQLVRELHTDGVGPKDIAALLSLTKGSVNGIIYLGQITEPD